MDASAAPAESQHSRGDVGFWKRLAASLTRVTSHGRYVPAIDGLRCIAIVAVMLFHLNESLVVSRPELEAPARSTTLFQVLKVGHVGVPLFFSISGFILALPFLEAHQRQKPFNQQRYWLRRLTRLEPPYLLNLFLITGLLVIVRGDSLADLSWPLLASMGYLHNLIYGEMSRINCVAWSLEIEVQFYLLMPLMVATYLAAGQRRRWWLLAVIVGLCLLKIGIQQAGAYPGPQQPASAWFKRLMLALPWHLEHFLVGIWLADWYFTDWQSNPKVSSAWDWTGLVTWPLLVVSQWHVDARHCLPLLILPAYMAALRGPLMKSLFSWTPIAIIGGMCYTLYLYHFYVISFVSKITIPRLSGISYPLALSIQTALIIPLTLLLGAILFRCVERPCMQWRPWEKRPERNSHELAAELLVNKADPVGR